MEMDLENLKKFLFRNAMKGKWEEVVRKYSTDIRAHDAKITKLGDTALHIAVSDTQESVIEKLVKILSVDYPNSKKVLRMENDRSITPLHIAATLGSTKMCHYIASTDPSLVSIRNDDGETPLFLAALHGNKDAFLCLHSFCSIDRDQVYLNCRRSKDGETILHCAIMGDFFDLACHIIKLYKELINSVNVHGFSPLHLLATKASAFKSGTHFGRWKMIIYHCVFVDQLKVDPNSYRRNLSPEKRLSPYESGHPDNYKTCTNFFNLLWKGIQVVTKKKETEEDKIRINADTENPQHGGHDSKVSHQGYEFFPENYVTCFNFSKFVSKAMLVILGLGFREVKKIQDRKEKHMWSLQVMNKLLECASMYEYDDNGSTPLMKAESTKEDGTQPYSVIGDSVAFVDDNISEHQIEHLQTVVSARVPNNQEKKNIEGEVKGQEINEGSTNIIISSKNSVVEKICKYFPIMVRDMSSNKNLVIKAVEMENESRLKETPVLIAAKNGVVEMVEKILELFPVAIHDMNVDKKNIVLLAVENRQPCVYQFLLKRSLLRESVFRKVDRDGNSALHLAAKLGDHKPWLIPGAALQMQWELRWYQFVKDSMSVDFFTRYNYEGKTPKVIFIETHKELIKSGSEWLTNTSESCSLVAALIATVAFATSSTVPGGNDQNKGTPLLENQPAFDVFAIASLVALCCSVTAVVMFLAILTSRFQEKDFGSNLPRKLLIGLSSLFVSIAAMLVSFCAGHFFVLKDKLHYAVFPVYAITCLPVTFFAMAQFPLYVDLVWATLKKVPQRSYTVILPS